MGYLDGREKAKQIIEIIQHQIGALQEPPVLASVAVGYNPASQTYLSGVRKDCQKCGILMEEYTLLESANDRQVINLIDRLNASPVDGIIIQRPLPKHLTDAVYDAIARQKDVDCVNTYNIAALVKQSPFHIPCTAQAVMELLDFYEIKIEGRHCVIVGRSLSVGRPLADLMLAKNATVTVCHSKTNNLKEICSTADILVSAAGVPGLISKGHVKNGAVVVDVGTTPTKSGLLGDVDRAVEERASAITPVQGGVGPITRAVLMQNVLDSAAFKTMRERWECEPCQDQSG